MTGELLYGPDGEGEILSVIRQKLLTRVISHGSNIIYALGERVHKACIDIVGV